MYPSNVVMLLLLTSRICTSSTPAWLSHSAPLLRGSSRDAASAMNKTLTSSANSQKCGGAVGGVDGLTCEEALWGPTGDASMYCFQYGSACTLNCFAAESDMGKDPSACHTADTTFYLWDEPDTNCYQSYTWAGQQWLAYSSRWSTQILAMREGGFKFTTPLVKGDKISNNLNAFFEGCGAPCADRSNAAYIDINAVNAFCGSWNHGDCAAGAKFVVSEVEKTTQRRPVFVTNWSYLGGDASIEHELQAMAGVSGFFGSSGIVERVYWFGAKDVGGGSGQSVTYLTNEVPGESGKTMGTVWAETCAKLGEPLIFA